jgi:hypothetical protein
VGRQWVELRGPVGEGTEGRGREGPVNLFALLGGKLEKEGAQPEDDPLARDGGGEGVDPHVAQAREVLREGAGGDLLLEL